MTVMVAEDRSMCVSVRKKDVDARIKSAQGDFGLIPASPQSAIHARKISPDSPAGPGKPTSESRLVE